MRRWLGVLGWLAALAGCSDVQIAKQEIDLDEDGYVTEIDCDDSRKTVHPDAPELCDGLDNDCDDTVDEDADEALTFYADEDGDGYGDPRSPVDACEAPEGFVSDASDCDDGDAAVNPAAAEVCNGVDDDCDGSVDVGAADVRTFWEDGDGDGWGDAGSPVTGCVEPDGAVPNSDDCDDADNDIYPGAPETDCADPTDYNCDGVTEYADDDGDGWAACEDCDDSDAAISPAAREVCDPRDTDEDCDGAADDADNDAAGRTAWHLDGDGDRYGDPSQTADLCDPGAGYVADATDCDDANNLINPGRTEICDPLDLDEDCDGLADDADPSASGRATWYPDADGDGWGDASAPYTGCEAPAGYVTSGGDCDDAAAAVNPGAQEVCDPRDVDEDCDGSADDADPSVSGQGTYYLDADLDGFGDVSVQTCDPAYNEITTGGDCDDTDPDSSPLGTEVCGDGIDQDCSGADESCGGGGVCSGAPISTLNYNGMTYYMLALEPCLPYYAGNCCSGTTDQQEADAFCRLAGCTAAVNYTVQAILSTNCYCWGNCTGGNWQSNCCGGSDTRYFITEVMCR